ncbi:MAG: uridine diphosphate-N-acetylglucosamine-binding protein YvcK [Acidobacteriota bacterium]
MLGGGSGLSVLLRGLKQLVDGRDRLTAVVTVSDDGGSSGRLRRELGVLPPGDIRNCIVALADDEDLLARLFQYRFPNGNGLSGHSFGNLFLTALTGVTGDFYQAISTAEQILSVRGRILPATLGDVRLVARGLSGERYDGESAIGRSGERLATLELQPATAVAFAPAVEALEQADLVVLGPGSLYTSILPNLLIPGIRRALRRSSAPKILALNLMTQPGETDGMTAADHLEAIRLHAGDGLVDSVLINASRPADVLLRRYADASSQWIEADRNALEAFGVRVAERELLLDDDELIRHDPRRLARAVVDLATRLR